MYIYKKLQNNISTNEKIHKINVGKHKCTFEYNDSESKIINNDKLKKVL